MYNNEEDNWTTEWPRKSVKGYDTWTLSYQTPQVAGEQINCINYWEKDPFDEDDPGHDRWMNRVEQGTARFNRIGNEYTMAKIKWTLILAAYPLAGSLFPTPDFQSAFTRVSYRLVIYRLKRTHGDGVRPTTLFNWDGYEDYTGRAFPHILLTFNENNYQMFDILHDEIYTCTNSETQMVVRGELDLEGMRCSRATTRANQIYYKILATTFNETGIQSNSNRWPKAALSYETEFYDC